MTLFFVISPAQVETGNSYRGQKFFGNSPYGQFALHGGKPSFFANSGLDETNYVLPTGKFSLLVYRLHRNSVEIKVNDRRWSGGANVDENHIRFSANDAVSLGNVKSTCDSNAFQGRVAEILVYDAALDDAKVESVKTYLHDKWWGGKLFPTVAAITAAPAATSAPDTEAVATNSPTVAPIHKAPLEQTTVPLQQEQDPHQTSTTTKPIDDAAQEVATEDVAPAPKFDPRVNIFEWRPPLNAEQTKVAEWTKTVKEKVDFIRNFQLGGDVLRALIRQHHDELVSLRDGLFG
ncbi:hypothetical protein PHYBOEH_007635 [Phytophthora boehmeriae]|uniref:Uncharacterized protein n=1 Tax=Phytophthora boehmeriae TaxID=109152 RepID=A0A8T1W513_9STRA|nr:hypothetical protein PHYBOEH_007635 [Phytophthora boehmeriae]